MATALLAINEWTKNATIESLLTHSDFQLLLARHSSPPYHRGVRATALQIASMRKFPELLPQARAILADRQADTILLLSAINYLGNNGTPDDAATLKIFQQNSQQRALVQSTLTKALQTLHSHPQP
jgi:hypothetical protein